MSHDQSWILGAPFHFPLNLPLQLTISINVSHLFQLLETKYSSHLPYSPNAAHQQTQCLISQHAHGLVTSHILSPLPHSCPNHQQITTKSSIHLVLRHLPLNHIYGLSRVTACLPLKQDSSFQALSTASNTHTHLSWNATFLLLSCIGFHITNHNIPHISMFLCFLSPPRI